MASASPTTWASETRVSSGEELPGETDPSGDARSLVKITIIVGGGLMGLATAQALLDRGEALTVIEAREGVALETSFGNAGMMTPSMGDPWNGPSVHRHLASSLFNPRSPMKLRLRALPSLTTWGIRFLRNWASDRHLAATEANFRPGSYSVEGTRRLRHRLGSSTTLRIAAR